MACHSSVIQTMKRPRKVAAPERLRRPLVARVRRWLACQSRLIATATRLYTNTTRRSNRSTTLVLRVGKLIKLIQYILRIKPLISEGFANKTLCLTMALPGKEEACRQVHLKGEGYSGPEGVPDEVLVQTILPPRLLGSQNTGRRHLHIRRKIFTAYLPQNISVGNKYADVVVDGGGCDPLVDEDVNEIFADIHGGQVDDHLHYPCY